MHKYRKVKQDFELSTDENVMEVGVDIELDGYAEGYDQLNFISTVYEYNSEDGVIDPFFDVDVDAIHPFYYAMGAKKISKSQIQFQDKPRRVVNVTESQIITWRAEVSFVGLKNGKVHRLATFSFGFLYINGEVTRLMPRKITPTDFHLNAIEGLK